MPKFLSPEWLRALDEAAHASGGDSDGGDVTQLVVEQRVTGTPWGDVTYHAILGAEAAVRTGSAQAPHVVLLTDYETALQLHAATLNAQDAIANDRMKVRGQVDVLVRHTDALRALGDLFLDVRAQTETES